MQRDVLMSATRCASYIKEHTLETLRDHNSHRTINNFFPMWCTTLCTNKINQLLNFVIVILNYLTSKIAWLALRNFANCNDCIFDEASPTLHKQFSDLHIILVLICLVLCQIRSILA